MWRFRCPGCSYHWSQVFGRQLVLRASLVMAYSLRLSLSLLWESQGTQQDRPRWGSPHWGQAAVGKPSPVPCAFGGTMVSWLPGKWMHNGLFLPSAGVGYQPDVILWHGSLWPASRGSSQHDAWEIQATAQHGRSVNARNRALPGLLPGSPSPPPPFPHPQLHSETKQCKPATTPTERKGKGQNSYLSSLLLGGAWLQLQTEISEYPERCCKGTDAQRRGSVMQRGHNQTHRAQVSLGDSPGLIEP